MIARVSIQKNLKNCLRISIAVLVLGLTACGGGGGGSGSGNTNSDGETLSSVSRGFDIPTEISAVQLSGILAERQFDKIGYKLASELPEGSDYRKAVPSRYVEEHTLEQFDILEQVLGALAQTNYAEPENINQGPYKAIVAWIEDRDGREIKELQPWVVDSRMIIDDQGRDVNRVLFWIEETDDFGDIRLIKAEIKIYQSAAINTDGEVTDYGRWEMNVSFDDGNESFFTASSNIENGINVLRVQEHFVEGPEGAEFVIAMKGVLYRTDELGYGQVQYPDWESCWEAGTEDCVPQTVVARYSYNDNYLAVQKDNDPVSYRSRISTSDMVHRYGVYYQNSDATQGISEGDTIEKHLSFGFPVTYQDSNGGTQYAYYGAWQGRHELWGSGDSGIAAGTTVIRENTTGNSAQSYTVSPTINGTFTRRSLNTASLDDIKGIPVEVWVNDSFNLIYSSVNGWQFCDGITDWSTFPAGCLDRVTNSPIVLSSFTDFSSLEMEPGGRKWVSLFGNIYNYVYLSQDPGINGYTVPGFYQAEYGLDGKLEPVVPAIPYLPQDQDEMWVDIGGSIYVQYTGDFTGEKTGWVAKQLLDFIEETWTPVFADSSNDTDYSLDKGYEYYVNNQGSSYIVERVALNDTVSDYEVRSELQSAANPQNIASILPPGTDYLGLPWLPDLKLTLVTDPASANFLQLVYKQDDPASVEIESVGELYTQSDWGLQAYNVSGNPLDGNGLAVAVDEWGYPLAGESEPVEFNWEYSTGGWGTQQFLLDGNGDYVILASPVQLLPITVQNGAGNAKTLSLQFDGWMHGIPDLYGELSKSDWIMTADIADKIVNISAGTEVTDTDGVVYFVKPLEISVFLDSISADEITLSGGTVPDIGAAGQADLGTVAGFVAHGMGPIPAGTVIKYSEGNPVN